jgi:hypothetical protein
MYSKVNLNISIYYNNSLPTIYIPINDTNLITLNQKFNIILDASNASLNMGNTQNTNPKIVF